MILSIEEIAEGLKLTKFLGSIKAIDPVKDVVHFNSKEQVLNKDALNIVFVRIRTKPGVTLPEYQEITTLVGRKYLPSNVFSHDFIKEKAKSENLLMDLFTLEGMAIGVAVLYQKEQPANEGEKEPKKALKK